MENASFQSRAINRRSFLKLSGLLGLGTASAGLLPDTAEAVKFNRKMYKVSKTRLAMGTFVSMTLIHTSRAEAEEAMGRAFIEIDRLSGLLGRFENRTAVAMLNRDGYIKETPPELKHVVAQALYYNRLSHGAFDITVKPVVDLFKETVGEKKRPMPTEKQFNQALGLVGSRNIELFEQKIRFKEPGMGITLDGIAKGFIVDRASDVLVKNGVGNHLINAGGDIRTMGAKTGKRPWSIAIQDPLKGKKYPDTLQMKDGAIATSGNYEIYFDREKMFHHIVDPKSGRSPGSSTSVSVTAGTTMEADALATSVFVMKPSRGTAFVNRLAHCECLVIAKDGNLLSSKGWQGSAI